MTEPTDRDREVYLVRKGGYFYRPNAQGYTSNPDEAGRYTWEEAWKHSHPNGDDGPCDGIDIVHVREVASPRAQIERDTIARLAAQSGVSGFDLLERADAAKADAWDYSVGHSKAAAIITEAIAAAVAGERARRDDEIVAWLRSFGSVRCGEGMGISAMLDAGPLFAASLERGEISHD
jgi:hypothetical protein